MQKKNASAPPLSSARLLQNPLFRSLYDYYSEQIPPEICNTLFATLLSKLDTTPVHTIRPLLPANLLQPPCRLRTSLSKERLLSNK